MTVGDLRWEEGLLDQIGSSLDLRRPNRDAAESVLVELSDHIDVRGRTDQFIGIVDTATAVGKTYTAAAIIDYLAQDRGWRNFLIVTPGRVIRDKTIQNFSTGTKRSLVGQMTSPVEVITIDSFDTFTADAAMNDDAIVKVYVLTVQALIAPANSQTNRRTHAFQESLGGAFYAQLQALDDLVVIADEHHQYTGPVFSKAISDLHARALVGLTATPAKADLANVVYRYPLAAAIAEGWVKRPTIVGRSDDMDDVRTKLLDGLNIVERKRQVAAAQAENLGARINPVMLVVCRDTTEARDLAGMIREPNFADGRYSSDEVLEIHSGEKDSDEADVALWAKLASVENPLSPVRIILSVGMLKEGWDAKNVYVLLSTRPSVSNVLTEQVLGRGLRLPYGQLTGVPLLDTLDVIAHEQYEKLLASSGLLNETFVSHVTRHRAVRNSDGNLVSQQVTTPVEVVVRPTPPLGEPGTTQDGPAAGLDGAPIVELVDSQTRQAEIQQPEQASGPQTVPLMPGAPEIVVPVLTQVEKAADWSLTEITDLRPFVDLGRTLAADPMRYLRRMTLEASLTRNEDGTLSTEVSQAQAADQIEVSGVTVPTEEARKSLIDIIMTSSIVSSRADVARRERNAATEIVDAFVQGLNGDAQHLLSAYLTRARVRLLKALGDARKAASAKPAYQPHVDFKKLNVNRKNTRTISKDRMTKLSAARLRNSAFPGWTRSVLSINWFDSDAERRLAVLLDEQQNPIKWWIRLLVGDLPIDLDDSTGGRYHPDFIAIDSDGTHWVVETKANDHLKSDVVVAKRDRARQWATTVNATQGANMPKWRYVLASEADVDEASGSWPALLKLTGSTLT